MPAFGKEVELRLHKRRYACECGKRFYEPCRFIGRYQRRTTRTSMAMLTKLSDVRAYSKVAEEFGISIPTVVRLFNNISYSKSVVLPEVVGIDEFKGNTGGEKYNCILTDVDKKCVFHIESFCKLKSIDSSFSNTRTGNTQYRV